MTGSVSADTVALVTILPTLYSLIVYILSAFATIKGDVCTAFKYLSKTRLFYSCLILLVFLAAPSVGRIDGSVLSNRDIFIHQTNATAQVIDQGSCCSAQKGIDTYSYGIEGEVKVKHEEIGSQLFLPKIGVEEEPVTCVNSSTTPTVKVLKLLNEYFILLLRNMYSLSTIVFKAP